MTGRFSSARDDCIASLNAPDLRAIAAKLGNVDAKAVLGSIDWTDESVGALLNMRDSISTPYSTFERWLLLSAARDSWSALETSPVIDAIKELWAEDIEQIAQPTGRWMDILNLEHVRFRELARMVTLRRWPAGQFHWEAGALPLREMFYTPLRQLPALTRLLFEIGGRDRFAELHVNANRKNRLSLTLSEGQKSFQRVALSIELQPEIRAIFSLGWLTCESNRNAAPHLMWMREFFLSQGAFIASTTELPPEAGFLVGSEQRRKLYQQRLYRPKNTYVIWPREAAIHWANSWSA